MKTLVILSSFSSGSSAVAGFLERCGAHSCPPHMLTLDKRTPLAYENIFLKDTLEKLFDTNDASNDFNLKGSLESFADFFATWYQDQLTVCKGIGKKFMVIKNPLLIFTLHIIHARLENPFYIILKRPLNKIEETRIRRGWAPLLGKQGAKIIYNEISKKTSELNLPNVEIDFETFCTNTNERLKTIEMCNIKVSPEKLNEATGWLRK